MEQPLFLYLEEVKKDLTPSHLLEQKGKIDKKQ